MRVVRSSSSELVVYDSAHRFDRRRGILTVEARGVRGGTTRHEYRIDQVADAVVEDHTSRDSDGAESTTYRVVYVLATGERVPWTTYYTGTRADKERCAGEVRAFLRGSRQTSSGRDRPPSAESLVPSPD